MLSDHRSGVKKASGTSIQGPEEQKTQTSPKTSKTKRKTAPLPLLYLGLATPGLVRSFARPSSSSPITATKAPPNHHRRHQTSIGCQPRTFRAELTSIARHIKGSISAVIATTLDMNWSSLAPGWFADADRLGRDFYVHSPNSS